jgi:hypothetical protein
MKYKPNLTSLPSPTTSAPPITGAYIPVAAPRFLAWQPSTWPQTPTTVDEKFVYTLKHIFEESILAEIKNVISDAQKNLQHRGHVVAIALFCALDATSSYGYGARCGNQIPAFVRAHFTTEYHPYADHLLKLYRHAMIHSWNLFEVAILPGNERITGASGILEFGLLHFFEALVDGVHHFLECLEVDVGLQAMTLARYEALRKSAKA